MDRLIEGRREAILRLAREHGATRVRVFGSMARGGAGAESDVDLPVDLEQGRTLLDLGFSAQAAVAARTLPLRSRRRELRRF
jgi:uncharacterized protein